MLPMIDKMQWVIEVDLSQKRKKYAYSVNKCMW